MLYEINDRKNYDEGVKLRLIWNRIYNNKTDNKCQSTKINPLICQPTALFHFHKTLNLKYSMSNQLEKLFQF